MPSMLPEHPLAAVSNPDQMKPVRRGGHAGLAASSTREQ
jgi:hypothetical protein